VGPIKFVPNYLTRLTAHNVAEFRKVTPTAPKVITANTLNFQPIFECSLLKIVGRTPIPSGVHAASLGHSLACVKM